MAFTFVVMQDIAATKMMIFVGLLISLIIETL